MTPTNEIPEAFRPVDLFGNPIPQGSITGSQSYLMDTRRTDAPIAESPRMASLRAASAKDAPMLLEAPKATLADLSALRACQDRADELSSKIIMDRAARLGMKVDAQGDPRGNPFCLLVGTQEYRLSVPARGLPARCFR